jgi:hypothetical protein
LRELLDKQSSSVAGPGNAPSAQTVAGGLVQSNTAVGVALAALAAKVGGVI